ncbi:MAG: VWA domain-containing protein [Gammaproteobacteria bacterium]|nr:VWA domain-containing protein [Gammaproteobacteria bacterium]
MRRNRETDSYSVAFLDVMSCGFGAIILLLMITRSAAPVIIEISDVDTTGSVNELQEQLFAIRGETTTLDRELNAKQEQLSTYQERVARLRRELTQAQAQHQITSQTSEETADELGQLNIARQALSAEMQRLLEQNFAKQDNVIAGIPVDSEYIIFVIDTSGSMYQSSWSRMLEVIGNTLDVYPEVKGIQVMNDMGDYMFDSYRGQWIPDTPSRRNLIISTLRTWNPYSNSSPVEGVTRAINSFYSPDKKISIYVLGDDFQPGGSITEVLRVIQRINLEGADGERLVRIHGIGFPNIFQLDRRFQQSVYRYSNLMRELTQRNGGTFVGLNDYR